MDISIIIATWNNSRRLSITLETFSHCHIPTELSWEIILVNNNCTDNTDEIVAQFQDRLPIKYIKEPRQGVSIARNSAIKNASGELILFTDDDVKVPANWISAYWKAFKEKPNNYFLGGSVESEFETKKPPQALLVISTPDVKGLNFGNEDRILNKKEYFIGANWAVPAAALKHVGNYDENLGLNPKSGRVKVGEESELMDRLRQAGYILYYLPTVTVKHLVPEAKCTHTHIGNRIEASSYDQAHIYLKEKSAQIFNLPRWMIVALIVNYLKWLVSCITFHREYKNYIEFRRLKGSLRGIRDYNKRKSANYA